MNLVFANSFPTLSAASVYSNPCAKTMLKPREAKSRSESSKSAGDCVCTSAVSTFRSFLISVAMRTNAFGMWVTALARTLSGSTAF